MAGEQVQQSKNTPNGGKPAGQTIGSQDQVHQIPIGDVYAPHAWNGRNAGADPSKPQYAVYKPKVDGQLVSDGFAPVDEEGAGAQYSTKFSGLVEAIRLDGQDTPVTVRPTPPEMVKEAGKKPYVLTVGFRRFEAVRMLHETGAGLTNVQKGCIRAFVIPETEAEALARNGRENTAREALPAPDVCMQVIRLVKLGMPQTLIATKLDRAESFISKLKDIGEKVKPTILIAWRNNVSLDGKALTKRAISSDVMAKIGAGAPDEQEATYAKACKASVAAVADPITRANAWLKNGEKKAESIGFTLGVLARPDVGLLQDNAATRHKLEKYIGEWITLNPKKNEKEQKNPAKWQAKVEKGYGVCAAALVKGFQAGAKPEEEEEEEEDDEEGEEGEE